MRRSLEIGLPAADTIEDRTISTFSRTELPHFAGINTFMHFPYLEDVREVGNYDVAIVGAPFDMGTTYRAGASPGNLAVGYGVVASGLALGVEETLHACLYATVASRRGVPRVPAAPPDPLLRLRLPAGDHLPTRAGSTLIAWDAYAAGRVGRLERFAFDALRSWTQVWREGVPEVVDGFELTGGME
jgi:UreD urease accessory protein